MTEATTHEIEIRRMMIDCRILIATLERQRLSMVLWTMVVLALMGADLYVLWYLSVMRQAWVAAVCGATGIVSAMYLARSVYRFWRSWLVTYRACRQMFDLLQRLARYHGYSDPANDPR